MAAPTTGVTALVPTGVSAEGVSGASSFSSSRLSLCDYEELQEIGGGEMSEAAVESHSLGSLGSMSSSRKSSMGDESASLESASSSSSSSGSSSYSISGSIEALLGATAAGDASISTKEVKDVDVDDVDDVMGGKDVVTRVTRPVTLEVTREVTQSVQPVLKDVSPPQKPVQRAGGSPEAKGLNLKPSGVRHPAGNPRSPTKGPLKF
jgi:hypothetical protein